MKFLVFSIFMLINVLCFSQENTDSLDIEDIDYQDTIVKDNYFGFGIGTMILTPFIQGKSTWNPDSVSNWKSFPTTSFTVGLSYRRNLNPKLFLESGLNINVSSLHFECKEKMKTKNAYLQYSLLELPLSLIYKTNENFRGFNYGLGARYLLDVTSSQDVDARPFSLEKSTLVANPFISYVVVNKQNTKFEFRLNYNIGIMDINEKNNNKFNNSISSIYLQSFGLQFVIF